MDYHPANAVQAARDRLPISAILSICHSGCRVVWITTSVQPTKVVLTVENTGATLTPRLVSILTEPFQRGAERMRTDHAGVGIGLAIVKRIIRAHGGTLT